MQQQTTPIDETSRINQLDVLRGFALLGILLMNIQSFSMPSAAYLNPMAWGNFEGINFYTWSLLNILADSKFMGIFSILFGAGICLFAERLSQKNIPPTALHYKRNFWLLIFGLFHAHFIWYGDILVAYALCAFWVYWFRNKSPRFLVIISFLFLLLPFLYSLFVGYALNNHYIPEEAVNEILRFWKPDDAQVSREIAAYSGDFLQQFQIRSQQALFLETDVFLTTIVWRAGGMMLLGMALYKSGILSGKASNAFYLTMAALGMFVGIALSCYGVQKNMAHDFSFEYSMFIGSQYNYWGSIFSALGYIAVINLLINHGLFISIQKRLAAVGRMAFTNYIVQSLIATFIFYGFGLGLFAQVERGQQLIIVLAIWLLQLWYSPFWLKKYSFGPLEWLWRSLTYWQKQPFRRL